MKQKTLIGIVVLLLLLVGAWALGWFGERVDPAVAELQEMIETPPEVQRSLTEEQRREGGEMFRQRLEGLTSEQRSAFFETAMPMMMAGMARGAADFRDRLDAMTPEERQQALDQVIDQMASWGNQGGGGGAGRGGWGGGEATPERIDAFRKKMLDWTTPEQRADMEALGEMLANRRKERGLPEMPGQGGGFF